MQLFFYSNSKTRKIFKHRNVISFSSQNVLVRVIERKNAKLKRRETDKEFKKKNLVGIKKKNSLIAVSYCQFYSKLIQKYK